MFWPPCSESAKAAQVAEYYRVHATATVTRKAHFIRVDTLGYRCRSVVSETDWPRAIFCIRVSPVPGRRRRLVLRVGGVTVGSVGTLGAAAVGLVSGPFAWLAVPLALGTYMFDKAAKVNHPVSPPKPKNPTSDVRRLECNEDTGNEPDASPTLGEWRHCRGSRSSQKPGDHLRCRSIA